ncbi:hypothetical protein [Paraglaciecola sp. 2405UD69-4]|uniref:hypothetical protein n=1 Tax=Paraglaciecola sp. 2405UD69-4 TaxID=3391836 RepID=UPI0039C9D362
MDVGSAGAGSISQNIPTQTGSQQQVVRAEQQETADINAVQATESAPPQSNERVGSIINTTA